MEIKTNRKITLLCLLLALFFLLNSQLFWKAIYPVYFKNEVAEASSQYNVDPYLVFSIIQIESNFKHMRTSNKGAKGLMQIMPETAEWVIEQAQLPSELLTKIDDPEVNIAIGSWYISFLERKFHQNHFAVIAAYNAGPGNVERWLKEDQWDGTYRNMADIPFGETRHYLQRVLYFYGKFRDIYE
ncbi:lytic transglycosylase [Ammoniphilus oxalaticus]|uniref:Lytic transglycosylase n=1 Tax=Ammoniphilus oxalaticus TaxID=66863 RepID=A0A419SIH5_9BACL|nr:lytic transglycosylase domain-containing protein [Ammoniphilus oxalaticus]RKD23795.1 lytic transglycosylase [Ammoniphilus oxalaticus]